jgi:hypothetical protein
VQVFSGKKLNKMFIRVLVVGLIINPICLFAQKSIDITFSFRNDTLKSKISHCNSPSPPSYYRLLNFTIDSNYLLIDSMKSNFNTDKTLDYIFVFSNKIQEGDLQITECNKKYNKRLLVVLLSKGNKYEASIINEKVVLNTTEYQSDPFRKITSLKNGFQLSFYFGTRIRYYYDFIFKFDGRSDFFLYKSKRESYDIHVSESNEIMEKKYLRTKSTNLKNMDIRNFIKH